MGYRRGALGHRGAVGYRTGALGHRGVLGVVGKPWVHWLWSVGGRSRCSGSRCAGYGWVTALHQDPREGRAYGTWSSSGALVEPRDQWSPTPAPPGAGQPPRDIAPVRPSCAGSRLREEGPRPRRARGTASPGRAPHSASRGELVPAPRGGGAPPGGGRSQPTGPQAGAPAPGDDAGRWAPQDHAPPALLSSGRTPGQREHSGPRAPVAEAVEVLGALPQGPDGPPDVLGVLGPVPGGWEPGQAGELAGGAGEPEWGGQPGLEGPTAGLTAGAGKVRASSLCARAPCRPHGAWGAAARGPQTVQPTVGFHAYLDATGVLSCAEGHSRLVQSWWRAACDCQGCGPMALHLRGPWCREGRG